MTELRAIVQSASENVLEARLLGVQIAVTSDSMDGIVEELEWAIAAEYQIAKELGYTPFVNCVDRISSKSDESEWRSLDGPNTETRTLNLPECVWDALAAAMGSPKRPTLSVKSFNMAA